MLEHEICHCKTSYIEPTASPLDNHDVEAVGQSDAD
jgi:hypothetical protein